MDVTKASTRHSHGTFPTSLDNGWSEGEDVPAIVAKYKRISDDTEGDAQGVARQDDDLERLAQLRRWRTVSYEDNDLSAYQRKVVRPQFEQMLKDLRSGVISGIVAADRDRLIRQPRDLERLIDIYEDNPELVCATLQGDVDLVTSDGRTMARVLCAFANKASADTGRRVIRKQLELAREGKHYGGQIPWFLSRDPDTRAAARREILAAHEAILKGASVNSVRLDWADRKIRPTTRGTGAGTLSHKSVKGILTNRALAGFREYKGQQVHDRDGNPVMGDWEAIVTPSRLAEVQAVIDGRRTADGRPSTAGFSYLLSGIAHCGICAAPMRGKLGKRQGGERYQRYLCDKSYSDGRGCGRVARSADPVDQLVIGLVLADEDRRRAEKAPPAPGWSQEDHLRAVLAEIKELEEAKIRREVSVSSFLRVVGPLEQERDELQMTKRRLEAKAARAAVLDASSQERFDRLSLPAQRERILRSLKMIVIHPAGQGARFRPDLIEPIWA